MSLTRRSLLSYGAAAASIAVLPAVSVAAPRRHSAVQKTSHVLLIIDIQNDYFPGGAMELVGSEEAAAHASRLLAAFRDSALPVVHVQHVSTNPNARFFAPNTPGVEIHERVKPIDGEPTIQKNFPNSFRDTGLLEHLNGLRFDTLVIAGMMTHMCIDTTTRAASDLGFTCMLAHDACATLDLSFGDVQVPASHVQASYLAALNGSFARVLPSDEISRQLKSARDESGAAATGSGD